MGNRQSRQGGSHIKSTIIYLKKNGNPGNTQNTKPEPGSQSYRISQLDTACHQRRVSSSIFFFLSLLLPYLFFPLLSLSVYASFLINLCLSWLGFLRRSDLPRSNSLDPDSPPCKLSNFTLCGFVFAFLVYFLNHLVVSLRRIWLYLISS